MFWCPSLVSDAPQLIMERLIYSDRKCYILNYFFLQLLFLGGNFLKVPPSMLHTSEENGFLQTIYKIRKYKWGKRAFLQYNIYFTKETYLQIFFTSKKAIDSSYLKCCFAFCLNLSIIGKNKKHIEVKEQKKRKKNQHTFHV